MSAIALALGGVAVLVGRDAAPPVMAGIAAAILVFVGAVIAHSFVHGPPHFCFVTDRPIPRVEHAAAPSKELFARHLDNFDRRADRLGVVPLGKFCASLVRGAARNSPTDALATVDALLGESDPAGPDALAALTWLKVHLLCAREQEARFCLVPTDVWSSVIETNLGLFLGG